MKMKPEHLEYLKVEIDKVLSKHNSNGELVAQYESGEVKAKDIQMRFCFDLLYGAGISRFVCDTLYDYLDDNHIYTALKSICPKLKV